LTAFDAYEDEMKDLAELSDRDVERVLGGDLRVNDPAGRELARRLARVRETYVQPPTEEVASAHLAAIADEAAPLRLGSLEHDARGRSNARPTRRFRMTPKRLAILPLGLVLAAFLATAGLAVAGVTLPDAARTPFDQLGIQLPNQSRASDVHAVIDATQPADRGCAFGQAVAAAASQGHSQAAGSACDHGQAATPAKGEDQQDSDTTETGSGGPPSGVPPTPPAGQEFGQSTATDAQQNASTDDQAFGQRTSQGAQDLTPSEPPADTGSQGDSDTGQANSAEGLSTASSPAGSSPGGSHIP